MAPAVPPPHGHALISFTLPLRMRCTKAIEDRVYKKAAFIFSSLAFLVWWKTAALWRGPPAHSQGGAEALSSTTLKELNPANNHIFIVNVFKQYKK